jgi:RNA polymerase sigma factor (sigma-70 family)
MPDDLLPTEQLLLRAGDGDTAALEALYGRYLPRLKRWAAGRLPAAARDLADTHDLVQDTLLQTFRNLHRFEIRGEGAFIAYLRRALLNRISNEVRRITRKPAPGQIPEDAQGTDPSPLEEVLGREALDRYETALQTLSESDRHAIIAKIEFGCSYEELTHILDKPTEAAARKTVERALRRLAAEMGHAG